MSTAQQIFDARFARPHEARSAEYKAGVLYILQFKTGETPKKPCPHRIGTAQADAWFAGASEGHDLFRDARDAEKLESTIARDLDPQSPPVPDAVDRKPTTDEQMGIAWWNNLDRAQRAYWLGFACSAKPADAWTAFKLEARAHG
jgi:hypothetical protein